MGGSVRCFLLAIVLSVTAVAAGAQPATTQLTDRQTAVAGKVLDLKFSVRDLTSPVVNMGGKTVDLQVKETATEIRIELAADILFDFDKSNIKPAASDTLKKVAGMIREHTGAAVRIEGHTDGKGKDAYNQRLSEQRAASVKNWFVAKEGLKGNKFSTQGFGAKKPVAPNTKPDGSDNPEGRQKNRRVEIVIKKG